MRQTAKLLLPTLALSALLGACGSSSTSSSASSAAQQAPGPSPAAIVKSASNAKLGATILVDTQGMTLYSLSAEQSGKFICTTAACLQVWHPLSAPSGGAPTGSVGHLSIVRRPDGTAQVAFNGRPLYTFGQDHSPGDAHGQGIKDVGTWTAVTTSASSRSAAPATSAPKPPPPTQSSSNRYGY
jgi:predicted lipoprotein with Yx(FWY)xxD motif